MVNLKSGQLWGWLDDVDKRQFLGGSGWCRKSMEILNWWSWVVGQYSMIFHYQMHPLVLVRTQRFLTSDVGSMLKGRRPSWMLYRRQKISWPRLVENCRTGCLEPHESQLMWIWDGFPGCLDLLWHINIYIYIILHHILIIWWQQLLFSSIPDSLKLPDFWRLLRSKAIWRRCHLGILPASSELWRRSKKARLVFFWRPH